MPLLHPCPHVMSDADYQAWLLRDLSLPNSFQSAFPEALAVAEAKSPTLGEELRWQAAAYWARKSL